MEHDSLDSSSQGFLRDKAQVLVGPNLFLSRTLRRDILFFDGFIDERVGYDAPREYAALIARLGETGTARDWEAAYAPYRDFSELSSLGMACSYADIGVSSEDFHYDLAIALCDEVLPRESSGPVGQISEVENARTAVEIQNEMTYAVATKLREKGSVLAVPRFAEAASPRRLQDQRAAIVRVVLDRFPNPDPSIGLEKILDFKRSKDSIRRLGSLNVLIGRLAREEVDPTDAAREIEQLLLEAKAVMRAERFAYRESKLVQVFRIGEAAIKGQIGELLERRRRERDNYEAQKELEMTLEDLAFVRNEVAAEWKHVAYILKAQEFADARQRAQSIT